MALGDARQVFEFPTGGDHFYGVLEDMGHDNNFFDGKEVLYESTPLKQLNSLSPLRLVKHIEIGSFICHAPNDRFHFAARKGKTDRKSQVVHSGHEFG